MKNNNPKYSCNSGMVALGILGPIAVVMILFFTLMIRSLFFPSAEALCERQADYDHRQCIQWSNANMKNLSLKDYRSTKQQCVDDYWDEVSGCNDSN